MDSVFKKKEEDIDLRIYEEVIAEFLENPKTYSLDEIIKELGFDNEIDEVPLVAQGERTPE
jgi:hypothetical protein